MREEESPTRTHVILKGFALKNLPPSESTIATVTSRKEEIPRRPTGLARNDNHVKRGISDFLPMLLNDTRKKNTVKIGSELQILPHLFYFFKYIYYVCPPYMSAMSLCRGRLCRKQTFEI